MTGGVRDLTLGGHRQGPLMLRAGARDVPHSPGYPREASHPAMLNSKAETSSENAVPLVSVKCTAGEEEWQPG